MMSEAVRWNRKEWCVVLALTFYLGVQNEANVKLPHLFSTIKQHHWSAGEQRCLLGLGFCRVLPKGVRNSNVLW